MSNNQLVTGTILGVLLAFVPYIGIVIGFVFLFIAVKKWRFYLSYGSERRKVGVSIALSVLAVCIGGVSSFLYTFPAPTAPPKEQGKLPKPKVEKKEPLPTVSEPVAVEGQSGLATRGYPAEGLYFVGDEIKPGLYYKESGGTYWERLSGISGSLSEIISNFRNDSDAPVYVEILESDQAFQSKGTGYWVPFDPSKQHELKTSFSDGIYLVGIDIEPGTYTASGEGYYEILNRVDGSIEAVEKGKLVNDEELIIIDEMVFAFKSTNGVQWTKNP